MASVSKQLEQLRKWRAFRVKDTSVGASILHMRRSLKKTSKHLSQLMDAWDKHVPPHLSSHAYPVSLRNGTLEVTADGAPIAFQLNRLIRSTLLRELQQECSGTLRQIRVRVSQETET